MKKGIFIAFFLIIFIFLSSLAPVFAIGENLGRPHENALDNLMQLRKKREEFRINQENKRENFQGQRQDLGEKIATKEAQARQRIVDRIKKIFSVILRRYQAALTRLDKIANRIALRVDKLKAEGVNTANAEAKLSAAESQGATASAAINSAKAKIDAIDSSSSTVRDAVMAAKSAVGDAKNALKAYHKALIETIRELRAEVKTNTGGQK